MNIYPKEYFELQIKFASRISEFTGKTLVDELIIYTSFYKDFKIEGWDFNPENPEWQKYLEFIYGKNLLDASYQYYQEKLRNNSIKEPEPIFGSFTFEIDNKDNSVQIHFRNYDRSGFGALSRKRLPERKRELKEMFQFIKEKYPKIKKVYGFSWLHNIDSYKRLFPESYYQNPKIYDDWFKTTALWGQFLDSENNLKKEMADEFLMKIKNSKSLNQLKKSFTYSVIEPSADIEEFYNYY